MPEPWPATLPIKFLTDSYSESCTDGRLRTQMETGPAKVRRRTSSMSTVMRGAFALDSEQLAVFKTFVETSLYGGTLTFIFYDQVDNSDILCRLGESMPSVVSMNGIDLWRVEVEFERLP